MESNEHAIVVDIEVHNEDAFLSTGGYSLSYSVGRKTKSLHSKAHVEIIYNPRKHNSNTLDKLLALSGEEAQIDLVETRQKAANPLSVILLKFVVEATAAHFFVQGSKVVFSRLKAALVDIASESLQENGTETVFHLTFPMKIGRHSVDVLIALKHDSPVMQDQETISISSAQAFVFGLVGDSNIRSIVLRPIKTSPYWEASHFVDSEGRTVTL